MLDRSVVQKAIEFHGHICPGLVMGIRMGEMCLREFGAHSDDNPLVAIVETDM